MKITKITEDELRAVVPEREDNISVPSHFSRVKHFLPAIKKVKFSGRATIVFWSDGDKTVVKDVDRRDVEHDTKLQWSGLALAICKKMYGDNFKPMFSAIETAIEKEAY